jgi:hypothetical protein
MTPSKTRLDRLEGDRAWARHRGLYGRHGVQASEFACRAAGYRSAVLGHALVRHSEGIGGR